MPQVGIIGLDVGVTTGMAYGRFNPELRDRAGLWVALARGRGVGWKELKANDITTAGLLVAKEVMDVIADWNLRGLGTDDVFVIIEDFQVRKDLIGGSKKDKLAPVFVAGLVSGVLVGKGWGRGVRYHSSSTSKSKASDERLKIWATLSHGSAGWIRGKRHARDAMRLIAVGLDKEVA